MSNDRRDRADRPRPLAGTPNGKLYRSAMKARYGREWREQAEKCKHPVTFDGVCQLCGERGVRK